MKIQNVKWKLFLSVVLLVYAIILYRFQIACPISAFFGIPCLGCGMTRALVSAARLELQTAYAYHRMFWSVPILYLAFLFDGNLFRKRWANALFYSVIAIGFVMNWVIQVAV